VCAGDGRLFGSYEALEGGLTNDALVDLTGGIGYRVDLTRKHELPQDLFARLQMQDKMSTLMSCSINVIMLITKSLIILSAPSMWLTWTMNGCIMPIICQFWDCKLLLVISLSHVSSKYPGLCHLLFSRHVSILQESVVIPSRLRGVYLLGLAGHSNNRSTGTRGFLTHCCALLLPAAAAAAVLSRDQSLRWRQWKMQQHRLHPVWSAAVLMQATRRTMETRLSNGLILGHAYSITRVLKVRWCC